MKTGCFFKLTLLSGFAALGLLAARVTQAQSPSGPITAAPSQSAPPTANGANQAPLPAPRTTILGAWKFNPEESDDPSKRRQESRGTNGAMVADAAGWAADIPAVVTAATADGVEKATKNGRRCTNSSRRRKRSRFR